MLGYPSTNNRIRRNPAGRLLSGIFLALVLTAHPVIAGDAEYARGLADKMLARLGGAPAWAQLRNTVNGSRQNRVAHPTEVYSVITIDFELPRFRIDTVGEDLNLIRVVNGADSWKISRGGKIEDLRQMRFDEDMRWYQAHIYRTIHRIASEDPVLQLRSSKLNFLEVFQQDERLLWLKLDAMGEPYAFGFYDDNEGSLSGPWDVVKNGIRHPSWVSSADGTWRAAVKALEFNVGLNPVTFARPAENLVSTEAKP